MADRRVPTLVLGEAPESDEEYETIITTDREHTTVNPTVELVSSVIGMAVIGEAIESDEEVELHNTHGKPRSKPDSKVEKAASITEKIQSASLKKLRERNKALYESLTGFKRQILNSTNHELSNINQQLLKSQIELQQTLMNIRSVKVNLNDYQKKLNDIVLADYIPVINIKVPAHVI